MNDSPLSRIVQVHKALSHPARVRILAMLRAGELCVCQVVDVLGLAPSTVSAHLRELRHAGLTSERRQGRWVNVGLATDGVAWPLADETLNRIGTDPRISADMERVRELRRIPVRDLCRFGFEGASKHLDEFPKEAHP